MRTRSIMACLALAALVIAPAGAAFAYGPHGGGKGPHGCPAYHGDMGGYYGECPDYDGPRRGRHHPMPPLPPEKQKAVDVLIKEYNDTVEPLRQKREARRLELNALSRNPNATQKQIRDVAEEISELSAQIRKADKEIHEKLAKETGWPRGHRSGKGGPDPKEER